MKKFILSAFADEYSENFSEQLEALKAFGIDYAELRFIDGVNIADLPKQRVKELKSQLECFSIGVSAIGSPLGKISLSDDFDEHLEKAKRVFETANTLGVKNIRFFSFYQPENRNIADYKAEVYERLDRLVSLSEQYGVTLCHENEAKIYGESPENCLELMKCFSGRIKCVFDMGNFLLDGYNPYPEALNALREHIEYFHIKDALAVGAIVPPGKGETKILETLRDYAATMNKDTFITLEPHLQTFSGLNALVGKGFDNPYKYPDCKTAFTDAVGCIRDILKKV